MPMHPSFAQRRNIVRAEGWFENLSNWGDEWVKTHCAELHHPNGYYLPPTYICAGEPGHTGPHRDCLDARHTWS
ncbi:hypothetical protein KXR83_05905 [Williamsia muralis]|uniref:hypothetical protein n=1 Tax=Williamsia marianensis TaxID=85044 RepID=UPI003F14C222